MCSCHQYYEVIFFTCGLVISGGQLLKTAELLNDEAILLHIRDKDMVAIEVRYHRSCHKKYVKVCITASFAQRFAS